jgi:2-polyprenyl-3-methyl-5-hydroxy-6-metoxy-1,4-benzoquinol methylase
MHDKTREHYRKLAASFDDNWAYSAEFIDWMNRNIVSRLPLRAGDRVMDLGCGTGLYSTALAARGASVLCVDPSDEMLAQIPRSEALIPLRSSAEEVVSNKVKLPSEYLNAILIKEAIHHVEDPAHILEGLARRLAPGGRILVVMLPTKIEYPLFTFALELFQRLQPDPLDIAADMRASGLRVQVQRESYELSFPKARYINMVRSRYMSLLSHFDDTELAQGIEEIDGRYPEDRLRFMDRQIFILGLRD